MPRKDSSSTTRTRGKDKQINRYAKYGKFTSKAIRCKELAIENQIAKQKTEKANS